MGRAPCCDKTKVKKGPWSPEEDAKLKEFIDKNGTGGNWIALPQKAGLKRCGKSCRLRWLNYLRPNIKHGEFTEDEDRIICSLYATIGSRWSIIAAQLPGRTDNDIKNYWNTKLKKKLMASLMHINPSSSFSKHRSIISSPPSPPLFSVPLPTPPPLPQPFYTTAPNEPSPFSMYDNSNNNKSPYYYNFQMMTHHQDQGNLVMFGGSEISGSSSDGSCSQISYIDRSKVDDHLKQQHERNQILGKYCFQGMSENNHNQIISSTNVGAFHDDNYQGHNFFLDYGNHEGQFGNNSGTIVTTTNHHQQMQYDFEVVRELVSSSSSSNGGRDNNSINVNNNNNNGNDFLLFNYENKSDEKAGLFFY